MKSCQSPSRMNSGNSVLQLRSLRSGTGSIWRITTDIKTSADSVAFVTCARCEPALGAIGESALFWCSWANANWAPRCWAPGVGPTKGCEALVPHSRSLTLTVLSETCWKSFCRALTVFLCSSFHKGADIGPPAGLMLSYSPVQLSSCNAHFPSISSYSWGCADRHSKPSQIAFKDAPPSWRRLESLCNLLGLQIPCHTTSSEQDTEFHCNGAKEGEINSQWFVFHNVTYRYPPEV